MRGKLYGVSVGPGDPELLTLKAVRVIEGADVLAVPDAGKGASRRSALNIIANHIFSQEILDCPMPMTHDQAALDAAHEGVAGLLASRLDAGRTVAFVTLGDAGIYSSLYYIVDLMRERGYEIEIVPGIPSFCAAAARMRRPLCEGAERLLIVPAANCGEGEIDRTLDVPANKVFMKVGRRLPELREALERRGLTEDAALAVDVGLTSERIEPDLSQVDEETSYFSLVLLRDGANCSGAPGGSYEHEPEEAPASAVQGAHEYPFVTHRDCPYFPCHEGVPADEFNCLFCYCPLYTLGPDCGGNFTYNAHGYKDCTACAMPHRGDAGTKLVKLHFAQLAELARHGADA